MNGKAEYQRLYVRLFHLVMAREMGEPIDNPEMQGIRRQMMAIPIPGKPAPNETREEYEDRIRGQWGVEVGAPLHAKAYR